VGSSVKKKWTKPMIKQAYFVVDIRDVIVSKFQIKLLKDMVDIPPRFAKLANKHFWELF
jgi:hypothetical protein